MNTITLPTWLFVLLLLAATYAIVVSVLFPSVRWFFRRRLNKAVDKLNAGLQIKIRPFQRTKRQILIEQLMFDQQVLEMIDAEAAKKNIPREVLQQNVKRYAKEIVPSFNAYVYYRLGYWLAKLVSRFIYRVRVSAVDIKALQGIDKDATVVLVMNHRSNMDYVLISYLASEQVALSYAVGEWARVFPLDSLIRAMGAFFVRRGSQNPLYRKVLERYVAMATQRGVCQAVFIEGGLSRDGSVGKPKLGFLDYILRHYDWQNDREVVFVPIGINYDTVLEDKNLIEWDNKAKRPSTFQHIKGIGNFLRENLFIKSRERWQKFGYASANFGEPLSAKHYCQQHDIDFVHLSKEERFAKVEIIAEELKWSLKHVMPVLPVPVVASVLLRHEKSLSCLEIITESNQLLDNIMQNGAAMRPNEKPRSKTLERSLENLVLRGLVIANGNKYQVNPDYSDLLQYYANSIAHWQDESSLPEIKLNEMKREAVV